MKSVFEERILSWTKRDNSEIISLHTHGDYRGISIYYKEIK